MTGEVRNRASLNAGSANNRAALSGSVKASTVIGSVSAGKIVVQHSDLPDYGGSYEVTPAACEQILPTKGRTMREDLSVTAIPYYEVSNDYGNTIYIGG